MDSVRPHQDYIYTTEESCESETILGYKCVAAKRTQTNNRRAVMETDSETTFMQFRIRTLCLITHGSNDTLPRAIAHLHEVSVLQMNKKMPLG